MCLTQHALDLPGVVVPGLDPVLDIGGDVVGGHVLDSAVHARTVVVLPRGCSPHHISHLGHQRLGQTTGSQSGVGRPALDWQTKEYTYTMLRI